MSLFKKPNRKYRARKVETDSEEEDNPIVSNIEVPKSEPTFDENEDDNDSNHEETVKPELKVKSTLKLSFDEEEEGETFKVKKSAYSRRMNKHAEKEKEKKKREKEDVKPEVPKLVTKIENTTHNVSDDESKESSVRKRMEKEKELSIKWIPNQIKQEPEDVDEAIELPGSDDDDDEDEDVNDSPNLRNGNNDNSFPQFRGVLERGVIPDAKTIYALKKQRQMARDAGEFISVDSDSNKYDENNRLMRDEDNDKSGEEDDEDEDDDRIDFAVDKEAQEKEKAREAFLQAQEEEENKDEYESEDELEKWEQEQIRKGGGANLLASTFGTSQLNEDPSSLFSSRNSDTVIEYTDFKRKTKTVPDHLLKPRKKVSQNEVILKMTQEVKLMRANLESNERYVTNIGLEIEHSKNNIKRLEDEIEQLITKCDSLRTMKIQGS